MPCAFHSERQFPIYGLDPGCPFEPAQFPEFAPDLISFDGREWCPFHLPIESEDGETKSPKAEWDHARVADFNSAVFAFIDAAKKNKISVDLTGVEFSGRIDLRRYGDNNPLPDVSFAGARFGDEVWLNGARFDKNAGFNGARFNNDAYFFQARFGGDARFSEAQFDDDAMFVQVQIGAAARFTGTRFGNAAWFDDARFGDEVGFTNAQFGSDARFIGARFGGEVEFNRVRFKGNAYFSGAAATDGGGAGGSDPPVDYFPSSTKFESTTFDRLARFANRRFLDSTNFSSAVFHRAPDFHNCVLHQNTDFTGAKFKQFRGSEAARAYRTLKLAMEGHRARREEARFYGLEQKSLLFSWETGPIDKLFSTLYWLLANYGQTVWLPLVWLVALQFGFAWFYSETFSELSTKEFEETMRFSLRQVFRPFDIFREVANGPRYSLPLIVTAAGQSLATYGLFALFLLALRRRFRMG